MSKITMPACRECTICDETIWRTLPDQVMHAMGEHRVTSRYQKGDVIFHEGSACSGLFSLCTGKVKLVRSGRGGRQTIVRILGSGKTLEETDLFRQDGRHSVTAQAMEDTVVCFINRGAMLEYLGQHPTVMMDLLRRLSDALYKTEQRVESLATKDARLRLAEFLCDMAEEEGAPHPHGGVRIGIRLTREEVAEVIGATLETTIRLMSTLKKDGLLTDEDGHIVVADLPRLKRINRSGVAG